MKLHLLITLSFTLIASAQWINKSPMPTARSDLSATTVGDYIYLAGGCSTNQVCPPEFSFCYCQELTNKTEAYHPASDTWTTLSDMIRPRYRHGAAAIGSKIYLIGGRDIQDNIIQEIDVYDIPTDTWSIVDTLYTWGNATSDLTVTTLGTKLYAVGGYNYEYVAMTTTWVLDTALPLPRWEGNEVSQMSQRRGDACAVGLDNKIYVFGGFSDANFCAALSELEVYDPSTNVWTKEQSLHYPRGDGACAVQHGKFHAIGGEIKDSETNCSVHSIAVSHVEYYDPVTGKWNDETPIPEVRFRFSAAAWENNFYVFGGQSALVGTEYPVVNTVLGIQDNTPPDVGSAKKVAVNVLFVIALLCLGLF
jgi:N-acetylneuraminic acid mutarotase